MILTLVSFRVLCPRDKQQPTTKRAAETHRPLLHEGNGLVGVGALVSPELILDVVVAHDLELVWKKL